ncbi:thiamine phosphate synthase [Bacillus smithii]|uniref:thiamine phosphate synthase n=1 Tax=Bacillus smithii TaxID=1479 RepID=UPI003D2095B4
MKFNVKQALSLYLVTSESMELEELLNKVEAAIQGGVTMVQLREKQSSGKLFLKKALALKSLTEKYEIPLVINDRVDIALAAGADGVHVGQSDLPAAYVKKIVPPSMFVGVSCSTVEEAKEAEKQGADYLGVGAVFPTNSKKDAERLEKGMLESIVESVNIPVVAIGGINLENVQQLSHTGIDGIAVVSAILSNNNPKLAAEMLKSARLKG